MSKTVIVPALGFIDWDGGVDYLKYQLKYLIELKESGKISKVILLLPKISLFKEIKRIVKNCIKFFIRKKLDKKQVFKYSLFIKDDEIKRKIKFRYYYFDENSGRKSIQWYSRRYKNSLVFPTNKPLENLNCKQVGYIPDLQHIHLPIFFSEQEKLERDIAFKKLLEKCDGIIVNSLDVKQDIMKNYPKESLNTKIFSGPFLPIVDKKKLVNLTDISKYNLPEKYFIISSQLWVHKDHKTAFNALKILQNEQEYSDVHIVCTGDTRDYRFPNYFNEIQEYIEQQGIKNNIRFLGFIPKDDQIAILKKSIAVVQPTLFEGGPGGGATYEAVSYGVRAIISNININKEIENENVFFFEKQNSQDLAKKMKHIVNAQRVATSVDYLLKQREKNIKLGADFLFDMISEIS